VQQQQRRRRLVAGEGDVEPQAARLDEAVLDPGELWDGWRGYGSILPGGTST
jgi:hypothetical protein